MQPAQPALLVPLVLAQQVLLEPQELQEHLVPLVLEVQPALQVQPALPAPLEPPALVQQVLLELLVPLELQVQLESLALPAF